MPTLTRELVSVLANEFVDEHADELASELVSFQICKLATSSLACSSASLLASSLTCFKYATSSLADKLVGELVGVLQICKLVNEFVNEFVGELVNEFVDNLVEKIAASLMACLTAAPLGCSTSQLISCRDTETCVENECRCRPAFIRLNDVCTEANKFSISVRALTLNGIDYEYTDALSDPNSPEFQAKANDFIIVMMQNTDTIYGVTVIEIQRGSLIFVAEAITEPSTTMAQLEQDIDSAIQEGSATAGPTTIFFAPDDTVIADINECASTTTNDCSENANCTNMVGSYTCTCHFGYTDRSPAGVGPARVCEVTSLGGFLGVGGIIGVAVGASVLVAILFLCCIIAVRRITHNNFAQRKRDPQTNVHLSSFRRAGDQRARRQGPGRPGDVFRHDDNLYRGYVGGTRGSTPKSEFMGY
eukprot:XP_011664433.1 PREDICTED: 63 kDa sperm flagellar membrane protein [Strongylocentrotus purpuratus]